MAIEVSPVPTHVTGQSGDIACVSKCTRDLSTSKQPKNFSRINSCKCLLKEHNMPQNNGMPSSNAPRCAHVEGNNDLPSENSSVSSNTVVVDGLTSTEKLTASNSHKSKNSLNSVEMPSVSFMGSENEQLEASKVQRTNTQVSEVMSSEKRLHPVLSYASESDVKRARELASDRRQPPASIDGILPPEYFAEAEQDLHEKQEWIARDVEALREMVLREDGLRARTDAAFLLTFLRARKFEYEKAFAMLQGYYQSRQANSELYSALTVRSLAAVWRQRLQTVLPVPDKHGRTVLVFRAGAWNPSEVSLDEVFRAQMLLLEHVVRNPVTQLKGIAVVVDCAGLGRSHAYHLTAAHVRRMVAVVQEVFPLRFKALHFINEPLMFEWMFSLVKPLLSDTIKKRLHFHGSNLHGLLEHMPGDALPSELGGSGPPLDNSELVHILTEQEPYFADHFSYGYVAKPRPSSRQSISKSHRRPLPRSASVSDAGRHAQLPSRRRCHGDQDLHSGDCTPSLRGSATDVGSVLGFYYRRMCID